MNDETPSGAEQLNAPVVLLLKAVRRQNRLISKANRKLSTLTLAVILLTLVLGYEKLLAITKDLPQVISQIKELFS